MNDTSEALPQEVLDQIASAFNVGAEVWVVSGDVGAACGAYATKARAKEAIENHFKEYSSGVVVEDPGDTESDHWKVYFRIGSMPHIIGSVTIVRTLVR